MNNRNGINGMVVGNYFDKVTDFSASDFTIPNYQLWVKKNLPKNKDVEQGLQPWVGQLVHKASYDHPEVNVIKEFSATRNIPISSATEPYKHVVIGGSIDRISNVIRGVWQIEDIKTQGMYPAKSAFKTPKSEWIKQLSVYAWLMEDYGFNVESVGIIHQYVMGFQKNKDGMEMYNKLEIPLMSMQDTDDMIVNKIDIARGPEPVSVDCDSWLCGYCDWSNSCRHNKL